MGLVWLTLLSGGDYPAFGQIETLYPAGNLHDYKIKRIRQKEFVWL